jgi:hypothetical protein
MFIPPPGAMQFEVDNRYYGGDVSPEQGGWVWVVPHPRDRYESRCNCRKAWRVIDFSGIGLKGKKAIEKLIKQRGILPGVCACVGHLIE